MKAEPICINLKSVFGGTYRIALDESHQPGETLDPWLFLIPGRYGHVYPYGGELLCAYTDRPKLKKILKAIPGADVWQEGDTELIVRFHVTRSDPVFKALKLQRKKKASPAQLEGLARGRASRRSLSPATSEFPNRGDERINATSCDTDEFPSVPNLSRQAS